MRFVIVIVMVLAVSAGTWFYFNQEQAEETAQPGTDNVDISSPVEQEARQPVVTPAPSEAPETAPLSEADRIFAEKQATYEKLEKARRDLDRRLARMKMSLWNVRLPREEADALSEQLMSAYKLITRPKLMGAFHNREEMQQELTQVEYAKEKVKELRLQIEARKQSGEG